MPRRFRACAVAVAVAFTAAPALADPPPKPAADPPAKSAAEPPAKPAASAAAADRQRQIDQAMALHDEARELYAHGEYRSAIARLEAAIAFDPEGKELVYNLALIHERLGEVDAAQTYYRRFLEMETEPKVRERVQAVLMRLEGAKKELALPPPPPPPRAPAPAPPPPPPPSGPRRPDGRVVAAGAVAVGAFLASGIFGLSAVAEDPGSHPATGPGVSIDDLESAAHSAHTRAVVADVTFLVGALATSTAVFLYTIGRPARPAARTAFGLPGLPQGAWRGLGASF